MGKYIIKGDQGELRLRKSKALAGLKLADQQGAAEKEYVEEEVHRHLGGFKLVKLKTGEHQGLDETLDEVRSKEEVEVGSHVYFAEGSDRPVIPTGEISIQYAEGTNEEEQMIVLDEFALELVERRSPYFVIARVTPNSPNPIKVAQAIQAVSLVRFAEPDLDTVLDRYETVPTDTLLNQQWHLQNRGAIPGVNLQLRTGADAKVMAAWKKLGQLGSNNITLAVIDDGFDLTHPDLKQKVFRPFDVWNNSPQISQGDWRYTHGTPCASVALAAANGRGIVGVAPNARFMPVSGTSFSDRLTEVMFGYCVQNGADVISCSWGTTDPAYRLNLRKQQAIADAVTRGRNGKGCVVVFAAGNEALNYLNYYAAHPDVIAVGASTSQDLHAPYSNQGRELTVCAPSSGDWPVIAARAWWDPGDTTQAGEFRFWVDGRSRDNYYKHFGGTSSAAPLVAGICALILSVNPNLTAREVKQLLIRTADKIGHASEYDSRGHSPKYGYGRVNALRAVEEAARLAGVAEPVGGGAPPSAPTTESGLFEVSVNDTVKMGWGVQIGAYSNYDNVMALVNRMERTYQQPVHVQVVESGGRTYYRVIVGAYTDINHARELQQRLLSAGYSGAFVKNLKDV